MRITVVGAFLIVAGVVVLVLILRGLIEESRLLPEQTPVGPTARRQILGV